MSWTWTMRVTSSPRAFLPPGLHLPVEAIVVAVHDRLEIDPDPIVAVGAGSGAGDLSAGDQLLGDALNGELAVDRDLVGVTRDLVRLEGDLRVPLGVEEVRC